MLEAALKDGNEYFHFLQGADLPLKTMDYIDEFCSSGEIYLYIRPRPDDFAHYKVLCRHPFADFKSFRNNKALKLVNHVFAHIQKPFVRFNKMYKRLYAGNATWSIPVSYAEYIMRQKNKIKKKYRFTLAADEVFIHTLCMESEYKEILSESGDARLIDWKNREGNSPRTFTIKDSEEIIQAILDPTLIFARKFSADRDMKIVEFVQHEVCRLDNHK